jgi:hypothetical protein
MLSTENVIQMTTLRQLCGACRYFVHDRCSHSSARLDSQETKAGDCPHFRFSNHVPADWVA